MLVKHIAAIGVLAALALMLFVHRVVIEAPERHGFESFDATEYFHPTAVYLHESLRDGRLPLWNPYQLAGQPFLALHVPGALYPPNLIVHSLLAPGDALAVLAVLTIGVGLVKIIQFVWLGVGRSGFVRSVVDGLRDGATGGAADELDQRRNPVARVMAAAVRGKANPDMSDTLVREETTRVAQAQLDGLERGLALLSLVATIAPLLGLLGTVLGMIEAFQQMETVGDRVEPAVLAGGIWEALLTTAAGLSVAIPAAVLFTWLQRAVDVEAQRMEDAATQVFTLPLYDGLKPVAA